MGIRQTISELIYAPQPKKVIIDSLQTLAMNGNAGKKIVVDLDKPFTTKITPTMVRVKPEALEACYIGDPVVFNSVNNATKIIMSAGYKVVGEERSVSFFEEFFDKIGSRGGDLEFNELLEKIFLHQFVYGKSFNEKIPASRDSNRIVDLDLVNPVTMDYAKDNQQQIVLDEYGDPVGYTQTLPYSYSIKNRVVPPKEVTLDPSQIFVPPERIAQYKLYTIGDGFYPIGLIEPAYSEIVRKANTASAWNNSINRNGFPVKEVIFGDENHEPTEEMIQRGLEKIKNLDHMGVMAHPYYVKVNMVESRAPEKLQGYLDFHTNEIVAASGQPTSLVTGAGEATNRSTLNSQIAILKMGLRETVQKTMNSFYKQIIKPIATYENLEPVKIVWGELSIEELDGKANRLLTYVNGGYITPDPAIEDLIRKIEDLPPRDKNAKANPITKTKPKLE